MARSDPFDNTAPAAAVTVRPDPALYVATARACCTVSRTNVANPTTTGVSPGQTINGRVLSTVEDVLLVGQTTPAENGIYRTSMTTGSTKQAHPTHPVIKISSGNEIGTYWSVTSVPTDTLFVAVPFENNPRPFDPGNAGAGANTPDRGTAWDNTAPGTKTP